MALTSAGAFSLFLQGKGILETYLTAGVLSLLDEPEEQLKIYALEKLNALVDLFWAEISDSVSKMYLSLVADMKDWM